MRNLGLKNRGGIASVPVVCPKFDVKVEIIDLKYGNIIADAFRFIKFFRNYSLISPIDSLCDSLSETRKMMKPNKIKFHHFYF